MDIISQFADPETIIHMTLGQKLMAGLIVTALGMGVTGVALTLLSWISRIMSFIVRGVEKRKTVMKGSYVPPQPLSEEIEVVGGDEVDEFELIAVITAAMAASLGKTVNEIRVTNIVRVGDVTPVWGQVGRQQQMMNRF